jgi:hypothetical protein
MIVGAGLVDNSVVNARSIYKTRPYEILHRTDRSLTFFVNLEIPSTWTEKIGVLKVALVKY